VEERNAKAERLRLKKADQARALASKGRGSKKKVAKVLTKGQGGNGKKKASA
jgi:phosphohistidine phosphatase SixA